MTDAPAIRAEPEPPSGPRPEPPSGLGWRLRRHFFVPPPGTPPTWYRFFVWAGFGYPIGAAGHGFFIWLLFTINQPALAWFNVGSALLYLGCIVGHRRGYFRLCYGAAAVEILVHATLATAYMGWDAGFTYHDLICVVAVMFAPFLSNRMKMATCAGIALLLAATFVYTRTVAPWRPPAEDAILILQSVNLLLFTLILAVAAYSYANAAERAEAALEAERQRSETLLHNVMPEEIADRLKADPAAIADNFKGVTVLFADLVGFTEMSTRMEPKALVDMLNGVFTRFDALTDRYGLEKIKTIGDAYMVVGGLPALREDHAEAVAALALDMMAAANESNTALRIGIHSGPVVAGVIGKRKFAYDLWGDTVNTAARMESHGEPGRIQVTRATRDLLGDEFAVEPRGEIEVKGKGKVEAFFLAGRTGP